MSVVMVLEMTGIGQGGVIVETSLLAEERRKGLCSGWLWPGNSLRTILPPTAPLGKLRVRLFFSDQGHQVMSCHLFSLNLPSPNSPQ